MMAVRRDDDTHMYVNKNGHLNVHTQLHANIMRVAVIMILTNLDF